LENEVLASEMRDLLYNQGETKTQQANTNTNTSSSASAAAVGGQGQGATTDKSQQSSLNLFKDSKLLINEIKYTELIQGQKLSQIQRYKDELEIHQEKLVGEVGYLEKVQGELLSKRKAMELDCQKLQNDLDDAASRQNNTMTQLHEDKERLSRERDKLGRKLKELSQDYDKLKQRWKKYRARRKLFEQETKTCKNCGKEYLEAENFNWSCRTHQSDFGGEMWWCCGKLGSQALGCKFSKHESKDDEDEIVDEKRSSATAMADGEEGEKKDEDGVGASSSPNKAKNAKIRCYSCKEMGHKVHFKGTF